MIYKTLNLKSAEHSLARENKMGILVCLRILKRGNLASLWD
jgi:hypothetical protein